MGRLPPPSDAGRCAPCRNCSQGFYTSGRCSGATAVDIRTCSRCQSKCPHGTYMHEVCRGDTFSPDSNDCRPCTTCNSGEFMSSGRCVDGTGATSPLQRACKPCSSCRHGEYKLSLCTGSAAYDLVECESCQACPQGSYISKPCDGTGTMGGFPDRECTECRVCPRGYYRKGCMNGTTASDDVQCLPCNPCPEGYHISPDEALQCPGTGFSPDQRTCIKCPSCGPGLYYSSGCTGRETTGDHTCSECLDRCPFGSYIAMGCTGQTTSPRPKQCLPCSPCPTSREYISGPCTGSGFSATSRTCSPCTCPGGYSVLVPCDRNGTSNHRCVDMQGNVYPPPPLPPVAPSPGAGDASAVATTTPVATHILSVTTTASPPVSVTSTPRPQSPVPTPAPQMPPSPTVPSPTPSQLPVPKSSSFAEQYAGLIAAVSVVGAVLLFVGLWCAMKKCH